MFGQFFPSKNAIPLSISALGSYGREQLSPKSDIDIMFVYKEVPGYNTKELIEKMYYLLLDAGLKLGHRVHEIEELEDPQTKRVYSRKNSRAQRIKSKIPLNDGTKFKRRSWRF